MQPLDAIARGFVLINWLAAQLNGVPIHAAPRKQIAAACFSVVQDHHSAVIVLLERELYASALALVRLQYEAYVRGLWIAHCATEVQIGRFAKGSEPPPMYRMLLDIEKLDAFKDRNLSTIKTDSWVAMCSFTHTGILQVERWLTATAIEPNYPPEELVEAANFTGAIALLSGIAFADLAENPELARKVLAQSRTFAQHEF